MADRVAVIIPAGGSGERLGANLPKALVTLADKTLIEHAVARMAPIASEIIVAAPSGLEKQFAELLGDGITIVTGGSTRSESVKAALAHVSSDTEFVLVHDAARSLASTELAQRVIDALASGEKAVIPTQAVVDTIKEVTTDGYVVKTVDRSTLAIAQTPQGFSYASLIAAHAASDSHTDDASVVEAVGVKVKVIAGEDRALKITTQADLAHANQFLVDGQNIADLRVGIGTDTHAFSYDSKKELALACLVWPEVAGLEGHSDGDVAAHAICDALLSAAKLGDLGSNFGTDRPEYAGASGAKLLQETLALVTHAGFAINNVSVQIVGNRPKIGSRRAEAIAALSAALGGAPVAVSATTTDGLGFTGDGRGLAAIATALLSSHASSR
jgi:2-C-methyl-D-erythritol 4-phosphate cytidylyltransferase/2-C-methyl-D-erythritol 2,4-cyclodiphosphate synthase